MKLFFVKINLIFGMLFFILTTLYAEETLQFELAPEKIKQTRVSEVKKGFYRVSVELNESNKEIFARLTENNIGKKLIIIVSGHILMQAVIEGKIDSGIISLGVYNSEEEAKKIVDGLDQNHSNTKKNEGIKGKENKGNKGDGCN
jgi:hypothetical protein